MNRNTPIKFGDIPQINHPRSKIDESHSITTTFNTGDIIPFDVQEILPGDTIQIDMSGIVQMMTPIVPVMDRAICDVYWFFVPRRLTWDHWEEFMGENDSEWTQPIEYEIPQIEAPEGGWHVGTIADYMGFPTYVENYSADAQYFRSYAKIYSDWFRSENLQKSAHYYKDETTRTGTNGENYVTNAELGGYPAKACKIPDYFTMALPEPQKGPNVTIPIGSTAPVTGGTVTTTLGGTVIPKIPGQNIDIPVKSLGDWTNSEAGILSQSNFHFIKPDGSDWMESNKIHNVAIRTSANGLYGNLIRIDEVGSDEGKNYGLLVPYNLHAKGYNGQEINGNTINGNDFTATSTLSNTGMIADLSDATATTINELRTAFALQRYFEAMAMYGSRYIETLRALFGVTSSDARLQRSEYLGGMRFDLNMGQVLQTSSTDQTSPQGNRAGFSVTNVKDSLFTKSFEEHGILMGMLVVRTAHTYQQGLNKIFCRKKREDFYNPYFAHLGNLPIFNKEIYLQGSDVINSETGEPYDEEVFGYQEAWAELRYIPNRVSGYIRSNTAEHGGSLDIYSYVDDYNSLPHLDKDWIIETESNVDRTLAVQSGVTHQFIADLYIREYATRCMPVNSVPGLIDHV